MTDTRLMPAMYILLVVAFITLLILQVRETTTQNDADVAARAEVLKHCKLRTVTTLAQRSDVIPTYVYAFDCAGTMVRTQDTAVLMAMGY